MKRKILLDIRITYKHFIDLVWQWRYEIILFMVICGASFVRVQSFQNSNQAGSTDSNRDYLIAHHIVSYRELPLVGPIGAFGSFGNSPAYYYLITIPLFLRDTIFSLALFNVFLQIMTLILFSILACVLFGKETGIIATILFGFSKNIIYQSGAIWQPYVMQPFLLLSFLFLFVSYSRRKYGILLASIGTFLFAAVLHQSVYVLIPVYVLCVVLILYVQRRSFLYYAGAFIAFLVTFSVLHAPLFLYLAYHESAISFTYQIFHSTFAGYQMGLIALLMERVKIFFGAFLVENLAFFSYLPLFLYIVGSACIGYLLWSRRSIEQKFFFSIVGVSIAQFFSAVSFIIIATPFPERYFMPILGLSIIFFAELMSGSIHQKPIFIVAKYSLVVSYIFIFFPHDNMQIVATTRSFIKDPLHFFESTYTYPPFFSEAIAAEVVAIKKMDRAENIHFFDVRTYRLGQEDRDPNVRLWVPLEYIFQMPLVRINDDVYFGYSLIGSPKYLFIYCEYSTNPESDCIHPFLINYPQYQIEKIVYKYPLIYLAKKQV